MKVEVIKESTSNYFFVCPSCGEGKHNYTHLVDDKKPCSFGPWYCNHCGISINGQVLNDFSVDLSVDATKRLIRTLVLLQYAATPEDPFYIIVEGMYFPENGKELGECDKFHYETHTCPWNFLQLPTIYRQDTDYHGIFTWVKTIPIPTMEEWVELLNGEKYDPDPKQLLYQVNELDIVQLNKLFFPSGERVALKLLE